MKVKLTMINVLKILKNKLLPEKYKQEILLLLAMKEHGLVPGDYTIKIDHINGVNMIDDLVVPIIYPDSFFHSAQKLHTKSKQCDFYFNGNMSVKGERQQLLSPFIDLNSIIIQSDYGRQFNNKGKFNLEYYRGLSDSNFGLCPHQRDWPGPENTKWTYRFIECCMAKCIPVLFVDAGLGEKFIEDFYYKTDEEVLKGNLTYQEKHLDDNFDLCRKKHTLNSEHYNKLSK